MRPLKEGMSLAAALLGGLAVVSGCRTQVPADDRNSATGSAHAGAVSAIRSMTANRAAHTATLLPDGRVLIAGGFVGNGGGLSSVELFDPTANTFAAVENMSTARAGHTATLLPNGKVLIAGGYSGEYQSTAEIYDPATNRFAPAGRMVTARSGHVATLLNDGKVLLVGGVGTGWTFLADAELFDPQTNTFSPTGRMAVPRESHTATLLKDGRVLITGGHRGRRPAITIHASAEIYDPSSGSFAAAGSLTVKRHKHDATQLADGRVLIVGGSDERDGDGAYRNAEVFNPSDGSFTAVKSAMNASRYKLQGTAVLLKNGRVLIAGGANRAEVFDPATNSFSLAAGDMGTNRLFATATLLKNGQVLITGGYDDRNVVSANAWIFSA